MKVGYKFVFKMEILCCSAIDLKKWNWSTSDSLLKKNDINHVSTA